MRTATPILATCAALLWASTALAQGYAGDVAIDADNVALGAKHYSPYLNQSYPNRVFFGDTHLHTSYSTDAGMIGNTLGPMRRSASRAAKRCALRSETTPS